MTNELNNKRVKDRVTKIVKLTKTIREAMESREEKMQLDNNISVTLELLEDEASKLNAEVPDD